MLFDEATSALDSESEAVVQKSIDQLLQAKERPTSVVVAHRLSTIVGCDRICVLQHGRLVESGTHSELMQKANGLYAANAKLFSLFEILLFNLFSKSQVLSFAAAAAPPPRLPLNTRPCTVAFTRPCSPRQPLAPIDFSRGLTSRPR